MLRLFGFKKKEKPIFYLLMDRDSHVLGKADLLNDLSEPNLQMKITEGSANRVEEVETVQVVPSDTKVPVLMGKLIMRRGNNIVLEPMRKLGEGVRRNFRMPVAFESFAYFPWGGRAPLRSIDKLVAKVLSVQSKASIERKPASQAQGHHLEHLRQVPLGFDRALLRRPLHRHHCGRGGPAPGGGL